MSWKATYLSLGGCLTLINSVLTSIQTYWMSEFHLPIWVVKEIDKIRRDFLRKEPKFGPKGFHLIAWRRVCRPHEMGGWEILNLHEFNIALLGKWWWKIYSGQKCWWSKIINFNYLSRGPWGPMFHLPPRNKSFFWAGITLILPSLRAYISMIVKNGDSTLLWFDNWLEGCAPKDLWLDLFNDCNFPWITIKQFVQDSPSHEIFFCTTTFSESLSFWSSIPNCSSN